MINRGTTQEPRPEPGRRDRKTGRQGITEGKKRKTGNCEASQTEPHHHHPVLGAPRVEAVCDASNSASGWRQCLVKSPVPTRQGLIPGSKGTRLLTVALGRPHGRPCEKYRQQGTSSNQKPARDRAGARRIESNRGARRSQPQGNHKGARTVQTESCKSSMTENSEPQNPTSGAPVSRWCVMYPAVLQGGLAVGASGSARRVVPIPDAS